MKKENKKTPQKQRKFQDLIYIYTVASCALNGKAPMDGALRLICQRLGCFKKNIA